MSPNPAASADQSEPKISHRRVLTIALPILVANVTVPILGAVDTGVVGQIPSPEPIAAVGIGAVILSAVYGLFGFLRMGTAGFTAQALGARDRDEVAALLTRVLLVGLGVGLALVLVQDGLFSLAFSLSPASAQVEDLARAYLQIRIWSAPAMIALFGVNGWLIAQERTRAVLLLQLWMNGVNVVLDLLFVLKLGWGVDGVAFATFLAEWSGLVVGLWLCRDGFRNPASRVWALVLDRARLLRMARVNGDILIRSLLLEAILVSFLLLGGRFGDVTLAANQVLWQFLHISGFAMDGFAFAAEALVGQAYGAGQLARLRRAAWLSTFWAAVFAAVTGVGFAVFGPWLIDLMAVDDAVRRAARDYLPWLVAAPILMIGMVMLDGIFIGATRSADMRNMMALSAVFYALALWLLMDPFGNHGLWAALSVAMVARGVTLSARLPALQRSVLERETMPG